MLDDILPVIKSLDNINWFGLNKQGFTMPNYNNQSSFFFSFVRKSCIYIYKLTLNS
jgi:hypothetical protein